MDQWIRIIIGTSILCLSLAGCGGGSTSSSTMTLPPPTSPSNLHITSHDGYNTLTWSRVANANNYHIYWSTQAGVTKTNSTKINRTQNTVNHGGLLNGQTYYYTISASNELGEGSLSPEVKAAPVNTTNGIDPLLTDQWHLNSGTALEQGVNVQPVWDLCGTNNTCRGEGVRVAVVDDGLQINHPDLLANIINGLSHNYIDGSNDPTPSNDYDAHGTSVAGIIAARDHNDEGVRGIAPRANLVAYNLLSHFSNSNEADAMTRGSPDVNISSNSWGPEDNTGELSESSLTWKTAIDYGVNNGRHGLGTIYIFAGGNGASANIDNSNYDGYANYRAVIAVAALDNKGVQTSYSEPGANILISAPGGEYCDTRAITTTDLTGSAGFNNNGLFDSYYQDLSDDNYTQCMNGTSAATPMVSGTVALMLQANPNLGWRDVRYILATTARQNDDTDKEWFINNQGTGHYINHKYGFGAVDADAAVRKARTWKNLGDQLMVEFTHDNVNKPIPDNNSNGVADVIPVTSNDINKIEAIEVTFSATDHTNAGDLDITLTSTSGTQSKLAQTHVCREWNGSNYEPVASCSTTYDQWTFSTVRHLDENADALWTLTVKDGAAGNTGTFQSWKLRIYGRADP